SHPGDRLAWLCALRAPWCGVRLHTLHELVGDDHRTDVPSLLRTRAASVSDNEDRRRLAHFVQAVSPEHNQSGEVPFAARVEEVWRRLGGPLAYPGARNAADAESFFCLLEEHAPYGGVDAARLTKALKQLYAS